MCFYMIFLPSHSNPILKHAAFCSHRKVSTSLPHEISTMEKRDGADLFVNDGSFFEKFKKLQQEKETAEQVKSNASASAAVGPPRPSVLVNKRPLDSKVPDGKGIAVSTSGGKLAFSLKQKSKVAIAPVKFSADEEEERGEAEGVCKRQKLSQVDSTQSSSVVEDVAPSPPSDPTVRKVAAKLASFVAKNGRQFEHITRQRNPGDTPFKFLFDSSCPDYKYYMSRLLEEEKAMAESKEPQSSDSSSVNTSTSTSSNVSQRNTIQQHSSYQAPSSTSSSRTSGMYNRSNVRPQPNYQTPASALYGTYEEAVNVGSSSSGESGGSATDSLAMMEFYMKKAAHEERKRPPKLSKDEMPPPSSQASGKKGHHMGDYIPQEELEKFLASCNDVAAQKAAREAAEKAKIQADNIGHKLLSKMGWKEGEGLGSDRSGRADPVMAGNVKLNNLGVGAHHPGEVTAEDDIYEQYKKRMMLGYRHRPNPLNNPRKSYY